jgi:hypothetical protein
MVPVTQITIAKGIPSARYKVVTQAAGCGMRFAVLIRRTFAWLEASSREALRGWPRAAKQPPCHGRCRGAGTDIALPVIKSIT